MVVEKEEPKVTLESIGEKYGIEKDKEFVSRIIIENITRELPDSPILRGSNYYINYFFSLLGFAPEIVLVFFLTDSLIYRIVSCSIILLLNTYFLNVRIRQWGSFYIRLKDIVERYS